jgi:6-phosphogluconolactonase (cycloisomerase 2 family)
MNAVHNGVIAYARDTAGMLTHAGTFATGGAGNDEVHLPSQGSVTLTQDRRDLLVTNVASNDVSVFLLEGAMPALNKTVPTASRRAASPSTTARVLARHR